MSCSHFVTDVSFFGALVVTRKVLTWSQAATEIDVTFDLAIYLRRQKYDRKIECSKNLP